MKIKLWCRTHDTQSEVEEVIESSDYGFTDEEIREMSDDTKRALNQVAEQFMWEEKQPEYGFEILEEKP
jgi:ribosome maturation protein Sdo1